MADRAATFYAGISIAAAIATIGLKFFAWKVTGSVGLLSDAAESGVNLLAALVALWALWRSSQPADATYAFGQTKAEYLSSGFEGMMILAAAAAIAVAGVDRLRNLQPIENVGLGLGVSVARVRDQRRRRPRPPPRREAPALHHAQSGRPAPPDGRLDVRRRPRRRLPREADGLARPRPRRRASRRREHRLDGRPPPSGNEPRPSRSGDRRRRPGRSRGSSRALSRPRRRHSRPPHARRGPASFHPDARPRAGGLARQARSRCLRGDRTRRRRSPARQQRPDPPRAARGPRVVGRPGTRHGVAAAGA